MSNLDLQQLAGIPVDKDGPVFRAPWEAQAFAMAVSLQAQGVFSWKEWADQLAQCIKAAQAGGDADLGDTYYEHWLAALESLVTAKGLASKHTLQRHQVKVREEHRRLHEHDHDHDHH
jgi:nitrile hydratase accessory protein